MPPPERLPMRCPPGRALPGVAGPLRLRAKLASPAVGRNLGLSKNRVMEIIRRAAA
jgi:hypothetical protein